MKLSLHASAAELAEQLVNISSVSGNETALAQAVEDFLRQATCLQVIRDGDAVIATSGKGRKGTVLCAGHLDTVPIKNNVPAKVSDGMLWGRGSVDMKGGCATFLDLARTFFPSLSYSHSRGCEGEKNEEDTRQEGDAYGQYAIGLTCIFYDHEEVASELNGLGRVMKNHRELFHADMGIIGEPTNGVIEAGCNGTLRMRLTARGKAAHSARPWTGENAIDKILPSAMLLAAHDPGSQRVGGVDFRQSLSLVGINGGANNNVVPDQAECTVNFRFAPSLTQEAAAKYVRALIGDQDVETMVTDTAPGATPDMNHPFARVLSQIVHERSGQSVRAKLGWTDVARLSQCAIPALNYGPGDPLLAHHDDERCSLSQIEECATVLKEWWSHINALA